MVAVLCASSTSIYHQMTGVDVYDAKRDARSFAGGVPVVAHPPCRGWSAFCRHQAKPEPGELELGLWCVEQLRLWGGVLEQPAYSRLWDAAGIPKPLQPPVDGVWSMMVDQSWWGDRRSKRTWLAFAHVEPERVVVPFRLHDPSRDREQWNTMSKNTRAATPPAMAKWLVAVARLAVTAD